MGPSESMTPDPKKWFEYTRDDGPLTKGQDGIVRNAFGCQINPRTHLCECADSFYCRRIPDEFLTIEEEDSARERSIERKKVEK